MEIGKYFTLEELTISQTATRRGIKNKPSAVAQNNLRTLVMMILDPLREAAGKPIIISSGYRSKELNTAIGGASQSQHCHGQAADLNIKGMSVTEVCALIHKLKLPYDQLIDEYGQWVHVSFREKPRGEFLTCRKVKGKTVYKRVN